METITRALVRARLAAQRAAGHPGSGERGERGERGDVPGWVLITLMTAGLVSVLWAVADDQLQTLFQRAMSSVAGP
jgi:hypothetical protein